MLDPEVLLLDEPAAALDPRSQSQIIDLLIGWGKGTGTRRVGSLDPALTRILRRLKELESPFAG